MLEVGRAEAGRARPSVALPPAQPFQRACSTSNHQHRFEAFQLGAADKPIWKDKASSEAQPVAEREAGGEKEEGEKEAQAHRLPLPSSLVS